MGEIMNMKEALEVYRGKKVFITGHTGFKGTWLTCILLEMGAKVTGYSLKPETEHSHFDLLNLATKIEHIEGDIRDFSLLKSSLLKSEPDIVLHLAAQPLVKRSYNDPIETFSTNVQGAVHLMEAVRHTPSVKSLVFVTSDKCYENVEWIWGYRENDHMGGHDPYSASKGAAELVYSAYFRSYFQQRGHFGAASARAGNVIGGGDWSADRIIPDCIRAIESGVNVELRNPKATRPWQHVLEPLSGYLLLGALLYKYQHKFSGPWNFGPSTAEVRTVYDVAANLFEKIGKGKVIVADSVSTIHEANLLQLNCDKAHQLIHWYPRWNADKTIDATAAWYKHFMEGKNVWEITKRQIADYFNKELV
jgi:CDP-glucose 4,6-dehydratase